MLGNDALDALCQRLGLSEQARAVIDTIRSAPPSRRVRSAAGNVAARYPSRKMGVTVQAESHRVELAGVYEHDPETLAFYDQPPAIRLAYRSASGRSVTVWHTPDYLVVRVDAVGWEEWKTEADLEQLGGAMPDRYVRGEDGRWRCPPGERLAEPLGFFHRVRSSAEVDRVVQRNLRFLGDYLRTDCPPVGEHAAGAVLALVAQRPGLRLDELLARAAATSDEIYALVANGRLHVDLRAAPLAEPERVRVFRDGETARAYAVVAGAPPSPLADSARRHVDCGEATADAGGLHASRTRRGCCH